MSSRLNGTLVIRNNKKKQTKSEAQKAELGI